MTGLDFGYKNAALAGFVAVFLVIVWLVMSRAGLKADLERIRAENIICRNANAEWFKKSEEMNRAILKLKTETLERQARARAAQEKALQASGRHTSQAREILAMQGTGKDCLDAEDLVRRYVRNRR